MKKQEKTIRIAVLAEEPIGWSSGKHYFPVILNNYSWIAKDKIYKFTTDYIYDKDILRGKLNVSKYDALLVPGGGVGDGEAIVKGFNFFPKVRKWKKQIRKFVKDGGGYVGICGGTTLCTSSHRRSDKKPTSSFEKKYDKSSIGISCVKHYYKDIAFRFFLPFQRDPEKIGAIGYVFSFAPGETKDKKYIHTAGVPVDFQISKDNPIFSDYKKDRIRIRWWGGPALIIPEKPGREVKVLARYPKKDISEDPETRIYAWKYAGGFIGLIKAFLRSLIFIKKNNHDLKKLLMYTYYFAKPWKLSDKNINLDFANKPSMISEIYPNKNRGRIIHCTSHPEYMVWWGGHIEETKEDKNNNIARGLHKWKDIEPLSKTIDKELTHTWWIIRKTTAWAAKIPDDHLPPITKEKTDDKIKKIIDENILWDGTIVNQIKNI
jgi:glutamine amidotransferase-like uncharacterized protein